MNYKLLQEDVPPGAFDCGNASINDWVTKSYYVTLLQHGYAYQIVGNDKILGYYMIVLRDIELNECPESISEFFEETLCNKIPSVCIKYIAIDKKYQGNKIGTTVLKSLIKKIREFADLFPIRVITLDALPELVEWYKQVGFREMPYNPPQQEGYTVYMYLDCIKNPEKLEKYVNL